MNFRGVDSIVMKGKWQDSGWSSILISALAHCWLPFICVYSISSDYWHYSKFAIDNQPQIPAKFLITLLEMSLGL